MKAGRRTHSKTSVKSKAPNLSNTVCFSSQESEHLKRKVGEWVWPSGRVGVAKASC